MFSIGIWDIKNETLYLTRDRAGEKPLYYSFLDDKFIFSSEIHELNNFFNNSLSFNHDAALRYLRKSCIKFHFHI